MHISIPMEDEIKPSSPVHATTFTIPDSDHDDVYEDADVTIPTYVCVEKNAEGGEKRAVRHTQTL